ncbi:rhodanese-like domain-containing protein [Pigmentiphaga sp.]|uniref:rhodanese-like domain-containing protein n=1 Tax=Pigmentiphaga sp. TaxID=1977564 RepID=UPI00128B8D22|nr:rhodanese-like domain-containing protein [Pigmentiphaga sp.]MPS28618.1 DUF2892 domain-containing protein [Alcaligenaceae bacterium SAGV5]MPS52363.1 DUF2892 domain-containing protein [Alcaligenaceae bacterium SAGV3]MPT58166.1 DUF2892 domain-containing protein [Alcaligenaceae bacterium]
MTLRQIPPRDVFTLLDQGALLIDIRDADEHARERIPRARHIPLARLAGAGPLADAGTPVVFHCRSGNRTRQNAAALAACAPGEAGILEGGLDAWKRAGLPVVKDRSQPLELQRQVQIVAGTLVALGVILGLAVNPWFHLLSGLVGGGLVFAGLSGFCGLARVLARLPWNAHRSG